MREDAPWYNKIFFSYAEPLLYSAMKEKLSFEQYGVMPEHLKIKYEIPRLEENLNYYVKKDPKDKYGVFKGVLNTHKQRFAIFLSAKLMLCIIGLYVPILMASFIEYLEREDNIGDSE